MSRSHDGGCVVFLALKKCARHFRRNPNLKSGRPTLVRKFLRKGAAGEASGALTRLLPAREHSGVGDFEHSFRAMSLRVHSRTDPVFAAASGQFGAGNAFGKAFAIDDDDFVFDVDALIRIEVS